MLKDIITIILKKKEYAKIFQKRYKLKVDGIVGKITLKKLNSLNTKSVIAFLNNRHYIKREKALTFEDVKKEKIMRYLSKAEGEYIHKNKGEVTITSPYGVYKKANPNANIFRELKTIIDPYVKDINNLYKYRHLINNILNYNIDTRIHIADVVYDFYINNYVNKRLIPYLNEKESMSVLSISIVTGYTNTMKLIQKTLGITVDGKIGRDSVKAIQNKSEDFNDKFLDKALEYFESLNNKRYIKGWRNRVKGLR